MFLEGTALGIAQQLPEASRRRVDEIAKRLSLAFAPSAAESHHQLVHRKLCKGESVEELYYDICMLWKQATDQPADMTEEVVLRSVLPFFLDALPSSIANQLNIKPSWMLKVDEVFATARVFVSELNIEQAKIVGAAFSGKSSSSGSEDKKKIKKKIFLALVFTLALG